MKVCLNPSPKTAPTDNGIGRILAAMGKYLPALGITLVEDPEGANVVAFHAGTALGKRVDVLHCHGLYWSDVPHAEFSNWHHEANRRIIDAARRAKVITVPSDWVAEPFRRDMRIEPTVIGHGIEVDKWIPGENRGYVLWNKNRSTDVCDPAPAIELAKKGIPVVSTFGKKGELVSTLKVIGQQPFEAMKLIIQSADIYLATTPETFGIGTLEAMICGVPVLGYDWCGTRDLVRHKETGWLVKPGDLKGLEEGYHWLKKHRKEIGANAREFAKGFDWSGIVEQYVRVYEEAAKPDPVGVSIVITNYNYGHWVIDAVESCLKQTVKPDEIILVDDGSKDNSRTVIAGLAKAHGLRYIFQDNRGVAAARNAGIEAARHPFVVCLDADDMLAPEYVASLKPALIADRGLGIAYPGVKFIRADGRDSGHSTYRPFDWSLQSAYGVPPPTCVPSGSMFRKAMWERAGGYRQKYAPGEDTEFWTRALSLGFTAELVTPEALFWYRGHPASASRTRKYVPINDDKPWIKDKRFPMAVPGKVTEIRSYFNPLISVIVPLGPGHEKYLLDAVNSLLAQTVREWEVIVVNDTGMEMALKEYPFIRWFMTKGKEGAGAARNVGIREARGQFVLFLDADDWLRRDALDAMLQGHVLSGRYVFSDFYLVEDGKVEEKRVHPYDREHYLTEQVMHSVTALVPTEWAREVGGFDPDLPGWEEYDFYMKLAIKGYCGVPVRQPLLYYRTETGTRRKISQKMAKPLNAGFAKKFKEVEMAGCCGNGADSLLEAKRALGLIPREEPVNLAELPNEVRMEFIGPYLGPVGFQVNGRTYYGARDDLHRFINAPKEDVEKLVATGKWKIMAVPKVEQVRIPAPDVPVAEPVTAASGPAPALESLMVKATPAKPVKPVQPVKQPKRG